MLLEVAHLTRPLIPYLLATHKLMQTWFHHYTQTQVLPKIAKTSGDFCKRRHNTVDPEITPAGTAQQPYTGHMPSPHPTCAEGKTQALSLSGRGRVGPSSEGCAQLDGQCDANESTTMLSALGRAQAQAPSRVLTTATLHILLPMCTI